MNHEFAVRFEVVPAPELYSGFEVDLGGPRAVVLKARNMAPFGHEETGIVSGVQADVHLDATDLDDAFRAVEPIARRFVVELSVMAAARCGEPEPRIVVDVGSPTEHHAFRQYIPFRTEISRRRVKPRDLDSIRNAINSFDERIEASIWRGMTAYRHAMATWDPLVEFLILWVAVEAMNEPLGIRRGLESPGRLEGTRAFFEERLKGGAELYRKAHDLRNRFAHGSRDLVAMSKEAKEIIGPMRFAARTAIASGLDMHWTGDQRPLKSWPTYLVIEADLIAPPGTPLGVKGDLPRLEVDPSTPPMLSREGSEVVFFSALPVKHLFGPGVTHAKKARMGIVGEQLSLEGAALWTTGLNGPQS